MGTQLLWTDIVVSLELLLKQMQGHNITTRERNKLKRMLHDIATLVPVTILMLLPVSTNSVLCSLVSLHEIVNWVPSSGLHTGIQEGRRQLPSFLLSPLYHITCIIYYIWKAIIDNCKQHNILISKSAIRKMCTMCIIARGLPHALAAIPICLNWSAEEGFAPLPPLLVFLILAWTYRKRLFPASSVWHE